MSRGSDEGTGESWGDYDAEGLGTSLGAGADAAGPA